MKRLRPEEYGRARKLFAPLAEWNVYLTAVLAGDSPGRVYLDDLAAPRSGFAVSLDAAYLAGAADNESFNAALRAELVATLLAGDRVNPADPMLSICLDGAAWEPALADVLGAWRWPPIWGQNHYYRLAAPRRDGPERLPPGYTIARLDADLLRRQAARLPRTIAESIRIGWQDEATFLAQGFGFVALHQTEIVCWCLADVVTGTACELGIETAPAHRRQGLATAVTRATVEFCRRQGFTHVGWHCGADNPGSIKTAVNAGFVLVQPYTAYAFYHDEARHYAELGRLYFHAGMMADAAEALAVALELDEDPPDYVCLLAARAEAELGNSQDALALLHLAVDAGFSDTALLDTLPEFTRLRRHFGWPTLRQRLPARKLANDD